MENREYVSILKKTLMNSSPVPTHIAGHQLTNANGEIDTNSAGFLFLIDTMTHIKTKVVGQQFYEIAPGDYMPVDVGEAAWMDTVVQNLTFNTGGSFYEGDIDTQQDTSRIASVDAAIAPISIPIKTWHKGTNWTLMELNKAAVSLKWDVVESKLKSLKKNWDLGIQETAFLGHPDGTVPGLLNDSEVTINTTLITKSLSSMSETEFSTFLAGLLPAYYANSNSTLVPDTFVIPTADYLGLGVPFSSTYPNISKLEYLINFLQKMTANPGFQVLPLTYAQSNINDSRGITKNRYILYRQSEDDLSMYIPVDFTMLAPMTANNFNWQQSGYGQYSGVLVNRKPSMLYLDETAGS